MQYLTAAGLIVLATLARLCVQPLIGLRLPFILYFPVLVLIAWYWPLGPMIFTSLLALLAALLFFMDSDPARGFTNQSNWVQVGLYLFAVSAIAVIASLGRAARRQTQEQELQARRAEARLRTEASRKDAILESALDGIVTMDRDGAILDFNPAAERIFGYVREDVVGRSVADMLIPPELRDRHREGLRRFHETGEGPVLGRRIEVTALRADSGTFPAELAIVATRESDQAVFFTAYIRDITERKRAEAELKSKTADIEQKNRELEQFIYTASHDLKTPLVTLSGFAHHIQQDVSAGRADRLPAFAAHVQEATARMKRTIDDVLAIARVGRVQTAPEQINLGEAVKQVLQLHLEDLKAGAVAVEVASDLPTITAERRAIEQVIDNLVSNALKYGCGRPQPRIEIGWRSAKESVELFVRDNGEGIDASYHERVFGLFERLHREPEGTGVGLALVRKTMEALGGKAWVESARGAGATFWIALPAKRFVPGAS